MLENSPILNVVKKSNRNRIITAIIFLIIVFAIFVASARYYYNFFFGPFDVGIERFAALKADDEFCQVLFCKYYITIKGEEVFDTGYYQFTTNEYGSKTTDHYYMALLVGEKLLLVETKSDKPGLTYTGEISKFKTEIQREIYDEILLENPELRDYIYPFLLRTQPFKVGGWLGIIIFVPTILICLLTILNALIRTADPYKHPIIKALAKYGDPDSTRREIEAEWQETTPKAGLVYVTEHWLIRQLGGKLNVFKLDEIVWLYKLVTQHRTYGVPTGKTFTAIVSKKDGKQISIQGTESQVDESLSAIAAGAPWAIKGYSDQLSALWRKDRQKIIQEVQQRKAEMKK